MGGRSHTSEAAREAMLVVQRGEKQSESASRDAKPLTDVRHKYAMISSEIRRDLQSPLSYFTRLDIHHLFRTAPWDDMKRNEFDEKTIRFRTPFDLVAKLRSIRPEIVQGPEPLSLLMLPYLVATLIYLWLNPTVRLVTLSLEPIPLGKKYHPILVPVFRLILYFWFRRATVIFWFDTGSRQNLVANGAPGEKLVNLIYGSWGIDPDEFSPVGPKVQVDTDEPVILYVGRLSPVKGVKYLIDGYKLLLDRGISAHLMIVGDGPARNELVEQAETLGINDRITWCGTVKNSDLAPYMRAGRFLVLPSITSKLWVQQLSITAWQAMGCGLPVISTQTGCMDEFTPPETGILVPERDATKLAEAMELLLSNPAKRQEMSKCARAYALERFDAHRNVKRAEEIILEWCVPSTLSVEDRSQSSFSSRVYRVYRKVGARAARVGLGKLLGPTARALNDRVDMAVTRLTNRNVPTSYSVNGLTLSFPSEGYFGAEITSDGYESQTTRAFQDVISPGMVIADVGAHIGHYSLVAADATGPTGAVYAFEPDPTSFGYLEQNIDKNGLSNVISPVQAAVGSSSGVVNLYIGRRDRVGNSIFQSANTTSQAIECKLLALDDFFAESNFSTVDVVKIDVEGAEYEVLRGMQQLSASNPRMKLFVEFFPRNLRDASVDLDDFFGLLLEMGFVKTTIIGERLESVQIPEDIPLLVRRCGSEFVNLVCEKSH